ncbi:MAG TPA: amidohydrolase family protein, partial [Gemmataceae bacterium]|nr:amidohydrolase family protein [Gemmataceae bacterium]
LPVVFEADTRDEIHRALDFAQEFHLKPILYGGRDAWKCVDRIKKLDVPVLLRLNYTDAQGHRIERQQRGFVMFRSPIDREDEKELPQRVQDDHKRLLREDLHNAAVLAKHGVLFAFSTQGQPADGGGDKFRETLRKVMTEGGLSADEALKALTVNAARLLGAQQQLGTITPGKAAHLVVIKGDFQDPKARVRYAFADGVRFDYTTERPRTARSGRSGGRPGRGATAQARGGRRGPAGRGSETSASTEASGPIIKNNQVTELEADRKPKLHTGGNVLIRGATVLTVSHGTLPDTDILVQSGKIAAIGKHLSAPHDVTVVSAEGLFVMPGIIDTHCHFAIAGSVNEFSLSVVPEVRVRDVVASDDVQIYRGLAGGVTMSRLLHGSANCIGGQDAVIKMKYGKPAADLIIHDAPRGVKFALGENVKRSNGRFPNTRLGVEAVFVRAFTEAQAYQKAWQDYTRAKATGKAAAEPRRDLRLEALADILRGDLKVHSHCYRQDEILMLMRTAERFGFRVKSLHHVLEGYKIAAEIAEHGASCSTFSDWWAYKMETYDAIPFNAALLNEAGVSVCIKSDSNELMRHLYQEAAKCIKYGGMSEQDALKTITLNGAKQLGLDKRTGSIDVGKDGDLVIFNGHPFNSYARPEMTLVEGEVYFQRSDKLQPSAVAKAGPTSPVSDLKPIAKNSSGCYALTGVTVHPVSRPTIEGATAIIEKGKITAVLKGTVQKNGVAQVDGKEGSALTIQHGDHAIVQAVPNGTTVVHLDGLHLYPGMIDAASAVGLSEIASIPETQDFSEIGDFQPDLRASTGLNPDSEQIPVTRANGVLSVAVSPEGALVSGQVAVIDLSGWVPREMLVEDSLALHMELPRPRPRFGRGPNRPSQRPSPAEVRRQNEEKLRRLKEVFQLALAYDKAHKQSPDLPVNTRLEALAPYARGDRPVIIHAQRRKEILDALKLAKDLKIKLIIRGGLDAWKVADQLKKQ